MAQYTVNCLANKQKLNEVNLDCFGIKKIHFEVVEQEGIKTYVAENVELTEEQVQYLMEHDFVVYEGN